MYLNDITFAGNLGDDAEKRTSKAGNGYATFSICYNESDKAGGEPKKTWLYVKVFGNWVDYAASFKKGDNVFVKGKLSISTSEKGKTYVEIIAFALGLIKKAERSEGTEEKKGPTASEIRFESGSAFDDIPF